MKTGERPQGRKFQNSRSGHMRKFCCCGDEGILLLDEDPDAFVMNLESTSSAEAHRWKDGWAVTGSAKETRSGRRHDPGWLG